MKTRLASALTAALATVLTATALGSSPAAADGPALEDGTPSIRLQPGEVNSYSSPNTHTVGSVLVDLNFPDGRGAAGGTTYTTTVHSCGSLVKEATMTQAADLRSMAVAGLSPSGYPDLSPNPVNMLIGDNTLVVTVTVTEPGYAPYMTAPVTVRFPGLGGRTCAEVAADPTGQSDDDTDVTPITVKKWSAKKRVTTAQVGRWLSVTPTRAPGAKVTYSWTVGTTAVDKDRSLLVKKAYRGKKVTLRITVSKDDAKTLSKTLRYGKVRR